MMLVDWSDLDAARLLDSSQVTDSSLLALARAIPPFAWMSHLRLCPFVDSGDDFDLGLANP